MLAKLVGFFFVMITLFLALVSDTKPLTTSLTSSLPKHIQPFVDSVYSTLRFSSIDHTVIEGGDWARSLYDSLVPRCPKTPTAEEGGAAALTRMYDGPEMPRTAFASFPRSGNTYTRELVERATGFRTSSSYCDPALRKAFLGECSRGNGSYFFRKTHYPALRCVAFALAFFLLVTDSITAAVNLASPRKSRWTTTAPSKSVRPPLSPPFSTLSILTMGSQSATPSTPSSPTGNGTTSKT